MSTLVLEPHDAAGPAAALVVEAVAARVASRLPDVEVRVGCGGAAGEVVVPLRMWSGAGVDGLGPDPLLTGVLQLRLLAAGARTRQAVVLAADAAPVPEALAGLRVTARLLEARWGGPVRVAQLRGPGRGLPAVVARLRAEGHAPAVASHLLTPGFAHERLRLQARDLGLRAVAAPVGDHAYVAELVVRRYREAARSGAVPERAGTRARSAIVTRAPETSASRSSGSMWPAPGATVSVAPGIAAAS